jgi:anti-sigma28 factor (negative regulator of flagellin synthesis)
MSMNKIDGSPLNQSRPLDSFQGTNRSEKSDGKLGGAVSSKPAETSAKTGDTVEISDKAKLLMEMRQIYESGLKAVGQVEDVREDKLAEVRSRLETGYYNSDEVRQQIADGVLSAFLGIEEL